MKVAIAWYGAEGQASYQYYTARGDDVTIVTTKVAPQFPIPKGAQSIVSDDAFEQLNGYDLVIRSSSVRPDSLKTDGKIWSATNEFFAQCPAPIIGVTGTKGKGTTSSLIAAMLRADGKTVHLVGNIGVPPLELLDSIQPTDFVVYELSSFQLWDIEKSPHIAVVLMIEPDHMNVHADMDEYVTAKARIAAFQTSSDLLVYNQRNTYAQSIAENSLAECKMPYQNEQYAHVADETLYFGDEVVCPVASVRVPGRHNLDNICAAISAVRGLVQDPNSLRRGIENFDGLPHRIKFVKTVDGVQYYDDSYSSAPGAAVAAIESFTQPEIVILGGFDRGLDLMEIAESAKRHPHFKKALIIGQTSSKLAACFDQLGLQDAYELVGEFSETVQRARELAEPGDVVILSPGCPSFDMFKDFTERGETFIKIMEEW